MIIKIKNLSVDMVLGVYAEERQKMQKVIVNLTIDFDEGKAAKTDYIGDTLDYHPICTYVSQTLANQQCNLLETLVEKIGVHVLGLEKVNNVFVEVDKPEAPIDGIESLSMSKFFES